MERWAQAEGRNVWYKLRSSALEAWKPCQGGGPPPPLTQGVSGGCGEDNEDRVSRARLGVLGSD